MQKRCTRFQHDWQNYEDAGAEAFWVVLHTIFFFLKEFKKKTKSKDEDQKDKHSWKIGSQES